MKIRCFENYDNYEATGKYEVMDIVKNGKRITADLCTECKSFKTALRRFFKTLSLSNEDYRKYFEDWTEEDIVESCNCGTFAQKAEYKNEDGKVCIDWSYEVEQQDEALWYISLSVIIEEITTGNLNLESKEINNINSTITETKSSITSKEITVSNRNEVNILNKMYIERDRLERIIGTKVDGNGDGWGQYVYSQRDRQIATKELKELEIKIEKVEKKFAIDNIFSKDHIK